MYVSHSLHPARAFVISLHIYITLPYGKSICCRSLLLGNLSVQKTEKCRKRRFLSIGALPAFLGSSMHKKIISRSRYYQARSNRSIFTLPQMELRSVQGVLLAVHLPKAKEYSYGTNTAPFPLVYDSSSTPAAMSTPGSLWDRTNGSLG